MRPAILVVRLPSVALALWGIALVVAMTLLSLLRTIVAVILLAVAAATVVVVARHIEM
jgi:hypothetical protein